MILNSLAFILAWTTCLINCKPPTAETESPTWQKCQVVCHPANPKIKKDSEATVEVAWKFAEKMLGEVPTSQDEPAALHLYELIDDYEKAEAKLTGGQFKKNLAFANVETKSGHVVIQPVCPRETLTKIGLPAMTRRLIAHETFHLVGYSLTPRYLELPRWIVDGAASYVDCKVLAENGWSAGSEKDPFTSRNAYSAAQLLNDGKLPKVRDIMHSELDALPPSTRYGLRWLLFRFLEEGPRPGSGGKLIRKMMRKLKESSDSSSSKPADRFTKLEDEFSGLDKDFAKFIRSLKPEWDEDFRSLDTSGKQWRQIAFPEKNAVAWRVAPVGQDQYEISGHVRILPGTTQQMNLYLGRSDEGFVSVAFVAGYGVTVFRFRTGKDEWENLATAKVNGIESGKDISFRVRVSVDEVKISIGKKSVLTAAVGDFSMRGPWGLGAQAGSAGTWTKIRCTPLAKPKGQ